MIVAAPDAASEPTPLLNWAGNLRYSAARLHRPGSVEEVQDTVRRAAKLRALGSRHSFNRVADTPEDLLSTERLNAVVGFDRAARTVTVEGGIRYGDLGRFLRGEGFALPNLASLPHISVAGAVATATHGSGVRNGNLATSVRAVEFVRADGELVRLSRDEDPETFPGAVVSLGALGPMVRLTLDVVPDFAIAQTVYERLPLAEIEANFNEVVSAAYSVSLFLRYREPIADQVWVKRAAADAPDEGTFFGARRADRPMHPVPGMDPINCTPQGGLAGPWDERLPHFRLEFTPSSGEELQSEFILPRRHAHAALMALQGLRDAIAPLLYVSELRTAAADDLWLSPMYGEESVCLHFTWLPLWPEVSALLPGIESALAPFGAKPHWGKLFAGEGSAVAALFPRLRDFDALARRHDPEGKFRNPFLEAILGTV